MFVRYSLRVFFFITQATEGCHMDDHLHVLLEMLPGSHQLFFESLHSLVLSFDKIVDVDGNEIAYLR